MQAVNLLLNENISLVIDADFFFFPQGFIFEKANGLDDVDKANGNESAAGACAVGEGITGRNFTAKSSYASQYA